MEKSLLFLPGPVQVADAVLKAMSRPLENHRGPEFAALLAEVAGRMQPVFETSGPVLLLGCSGTGGLEAAVTSLFSPGDRLLACPVGVFGKRLAAIARAFGCEVEELETPNGSALDPAALAARLEADTGKRIAGVLLTHNETSTGVQCDMALYAPALRAHGALSVVDSVSGLGAGPFHMEAWGYDAVVTASQKALAAPPGIAMVALGKRAVGQLERARAPRFYLDLRRALEFSAKGQTPWTPPISIVYALDAALTRYERTGAAAGWERHALYACAIRAAFEALGFTIFSRPGAHSRTVVAAQPPEGIAADDLVELLRKDRVILSGGQVELAGKIVRMGTMGDITQTDVLGAIGAIETTLLAADVPVHIGAGVKAALSVFLNREVAVPV
ncbi:MAG TPA: alanine--glyoxylate aminotransferase family protein [Verrucomicrobiae bacterium]|jgi:aspartate aminotransferase-like enzyme|nr:alanine--glyoxylate aminotransferase family protein [Verrucomicrobiae bacterium]